VWALRTEGLQLAEMLRKIVKYFAAHLSDTRKVPASRGAGPTEEQPPVVRICDEAYLQLRRLVNLEESMDQYLLNSRAFLNLPEARKDEEIRKSRQSRAFTRFTGR